MNTIDDNQRDIRTVAAGDGIDLQYEVVGDVRGDGPPIVLLHGALVGRAAFSRQRKTLAEKYRLILPSARAHDGTDATLPEDYGFATSEVRDVLTVMAAEGVERAHVIAHSSGGATAFQLARQFPDHVDRLILIEPSLFNLLPPEGLAPLTSELAAVIHAHESGGDLAALQACMENIGGDVWHALDEDAKALRLTRLAPMAPIILPHINGLHAFK
ncbi:MAG: alpha/beta fold hydrolase, partial [Alphaproteobacteria bacterium]|nr:alpha/beta fold hydrolase [Alphaproteobacteria bacterium]